MADTDAEGAWTVVRVELLTLHHAGEVMTRKHTIDRAGVGDDKILAPSPS